MVVIEDIIPKVDPKTIKSVKRGKGKKSKEAKKIKQSAAQIAVDKIRNKQQKKAAKKAESAEGSRGIIKLNHLPHGFYEEEIRSFFKQFGRVLRIKLARSPKTGKPKGFAFVEFEYEEVARIAAEAMNNYLMFNRLVKCKLLEDIENSHKVFANNKIRADDYPTLQNREKAKKDQEAKSDVVKEDFLAHKIRSLDKQHKRLAALGIDYTYESPKIEETRQNPEVQDAIAKKIEIEAAEKHAKELLDSKTPGIKVDKKFIKVFKKLKMTFPDLDDEAILSTITEMMPGVSPGPKAKRNSPAADTRELNSATDALTKRQSLTSTPSKSAGKRLANEESDTSTSPPTKRRSFGTPGSVVEKIVTPQSNKKPMTPKSVEKQTPKTKGSKVLNTPIKQLATPSPQKKMATPKQTPKGVSPVTSNIQVQKYVKKNLKESKKQTLQAKKSLTPQPKKSVTPQAKKSLTPQAKKLSTPQSKASKTPETKKSPTPDTKKVITPQAKKLPTPKSADVTPVPEKKVHAPKAPATSVPSIVDEMKETPTRKKKKSLPKVSPKMLRSKARQSYVPEPVFHSTPAKDSPIPRKSLAKEKITRVDKKTEKQVNVATPEVKPNAARRKSVAIGKEVATVQNPKFSPKLLRSRNNSGAVGPLKVEPTIKRGRKSVI